MHYVTVLDGLFLLSAFLYEIFVHFLFVKLSRLPVTLWMHIKFYVMY